MTKQEIKNKIAHLKKNESLLNVNGCSVTRQFDVKGEFNFRIDGLCCGINQFTANEIANELGI